MVNGADLLVDAFGRIRELVHATVKDLDLEALARQPGDGANSIAWLVWHLTRIQDDHLADVAGVEQVWISQGWAESFGLPLEAADTGYGHTPEQVASVAVESSALRRYHDAVHDATVAYLKTISDQDLDRVVDERWDPPVTLAVRLVSVVSDDLQHIGQAAYVRGLIKG
jgi:uncharacterized damage-inducible protein DinB